MSLRNRLFLLCFFVFTAVVAVAGLPTLALPGRRAALAVARGWSKGVMALARWIVGLRYEIRGRDHLPAGPCIIAAKHLSPWDTFILYVLLRDPAIVLKEELTKIPFFGWYLTKNGAIPLDRDAAALAMRHLIRRAKPAVDEGRQVLIFPEGTRVAPGQAGEYKPGVAGLYNQLKLPVIPVALNSGKFWPAKGWNLKPGLIVWEYLPPIPPGLSRDAFLARLEDEIETRTRELLAG